MTRLAGTADFDVEALAIYLRSALTVPCDSIAIERVSGGQSNPTYFVDLDADRLVLRKQPPGILLPSAHAIDREYRVMAALHGTDVPVPEVVHYCSDPTVIGTPFYLMRRVEGSVFHDGALKAADPADRRGMYRSLAVSLARLHRVDPAAIGLQDFGKHGGYFRRQIARWTRQWNLSCQRSDRHIETLIEWLPNHIPPDDLTVISHGDYRIGNVIFSPDDAKVASVLDWELSTLGHPLADLAHCCMTWHIKPDEYGGLLGVDLDAEHLPRQDEFEAWYAQEAGHSLTLRPFHMTFALFRFAVVFEGIAARVRGGNAADKDAVRLGALSAVFAERASAVSATLELPRRSGELF